MAKNNREIIQKNKASIKRGAYYFGIIGRLSLFFGFFTFISRLFMIYYIGSDDPEYQTSKLIWDLEPIIYGFLFLIARDAFLAVEAIANELEEIV